MARRRRLCHQSGDATAAAYLPRMILRDAPKLCPLWLAPRFVPACKPMIASDWRSCSSVKPRRFSSAGFGPKYGPCHSGCLYVCIMGAHKATMPIVDDDEEFLCISMQNQRKLTARPIAKMVWVTSAMFLKSHKSVVWNRSTSGTPYNVHAFWNLCAVTEANGKGKWERWRGREKNERMRGRQKERKRANFTGQRKHQWKLPGIILANGRIDRAQSAQF